MDPCSAAGCMPSGPGPEGAVICVLPQTGMARGQKEVAGWIQLWRTTDGINKEKNRDKHLHEPLF